MKALVNLKKPRRRFLAGAIITILGAAILAWVYPAFADAWTAVRHTDSKKSILPGIPPELRAQWEQMIDEVYWEFYEQAGLVGFGLLLLLCGIYLCLGSRRKLRELPKKR